MKQRPPWWPEDEAWPPAGPAWRAIRQRFFARAFIWFAFTLLLCGGFAFLAASVLARIGLSPGSLLGALFFVTIGFFIAGRSMRRITAPVGALLEAAGRVAEGDYTVRVPERGPREVRALARGFNSMAARLEQHDEQRRELLADITHELRTPLSVVQGNLEGLLDGVYPRDDAHLQMILDETRVLARLVEDLRTLALADSGALKLQREPVDLAVLANEVAASFRAQADASGVALSVDAESELPLIDVDPARMREVLANLLSNALRHTPQGGAVRVAYGADKGERVALSVRDTGSGIPPDDLPHIFDRFYRTHDSGGSGLGLAIAKNLVEAHGGDIRAESEPGRGATFVVALPLEA
jgi:two-component system OmpR family sensor kinase/two-component system sensor histidine kinase BaeS